MVDMYKNFGAKIVLELDNYYHYLDYTIFDYSRYYDYYYLNKF